MNRGGESGVALIAVLWLVVLLTLLATAVATLTVSHRRVVERYAEAVQTDLTIDSATRVVLLRILSSSQAEHAWPLGEPRSLNLLGRQLNVTITREAGRIDLNAADPQLFLAFFAANGWSERDALALAREINVRRGTEAPSGRSEPQETLARAARPSGALFHSVGELRLLPGLSGLSDELMDSFTVYSHMSVPLPSAATPAAYRALAWADAKNLGEHSWLDANASVETATSNNSNASWSREVLRVQTCITNDALPRCDRAVIRLTGAANLLAQVFVWEREAKIFSAEHP